MADHLKSEQILIRENDHFNTVLSGFWMVTVLFYSKHASDIFLVKMYHALGRVCKFVLKFYRISPSSLPLILHKEWNIAVVLHHVAFQDVRAGSQHPLEPSPIQLYTFQRPFGGHSSRTWSVQE